MTLPASLLAWLRPKPLVRQRWWLAAMLLGSLTPQVARADTSPPAPSPYALTPIPPGDDRIEPVRAGQAAPFEGMLFDTKTALRWGNYLEQGRVRWQSDVEAERRVGQAETAFWRGRLESERAYYQAVVQQQSVQIQQLSQVKEPPFYRQAWFGAVVATVVIAGGVAAGVALR